jgi:hypothetical protein
MQVVSECEVKQVTKSRYSRFDLASNHIYQASPALMRNTSHSDSFTFAMRVAVTLVLAAEHQRYEIENPLIHSRK